MTVYLFVRLFEHRVLRHEKEFGVKVVDLAKDPFAAGPLARSTTRNSSLDKALRRKFSSLPAVSRQRVRYH